MNFQEMGGAAAILTGFFGIIVLFVLWAHFTPFSSKSAKSKKPVPKSSQDKEYTGKVFRCGYMSTISSGGEMGLGNTYWACRFEGSVEVIRAKIMCDDLETAERAALTQPGDTLYMRVNKLGQIVELRNDALASGASRPDAANNRFVGQDGAA